MIRPGFIFATLLLFATLSAGICAERTAERGPFVDYWTAIRVGDLQIGCMHTTIAWVSEGGEKRLRATERVWIKARSDKESASIEAEHTVLANSDFTPSVEHVKIGGSFNGGATSDKPKVPELNAEFRYFPDHVYSVIVKNGKSKEEREPLKERPDYSHYLGGRKLKVGDEVRFPVLSLVGADAISSTRLGFNVSWALKVARSEDVAVDGKTYQAYLLTRDGSSAHTWVTANCELLKMEEPGSGFTMSRQPVAEALEWLESNGPDVSRVPVDRPIADYLHARVVKVRLLGIYDKGLVISDNRQQAVYLEDKRAAEYTISAKPFDPARSVALPVEGADLRRWRSASKGIESKDEAIRSLAMQVVGDETNAYAAAWKLRAWVHDNMTYTIEASRGSESALQILKTRKGVCTHYAILYTALARAVGLPSRIAVGLCYGNWDGPGSFQPHAWAESYVGEWIAVDPTWGDDLVDATHIKLAEGGIEALTGYRRSAGLLTAEVISPVLPPQTGRERVILAPTNVLIVRWPGEDLQWFCDNRCMPAGPPKIADGSLVITKANGDEWIIPPGHKLDSPDIPNIHYVRENHPDMITLLMPDGTIHAFPAEQTKLETYPPGEEP